MPLVEEKMDDKNVQSTQKILSGSSRCVWGRHHGVSRHVDFSRWQGADSPVLFGSAKFDPAFRLSLPEEDIIRSIYAPMVMVEPGDEWTWKAVVVETIEQLDDLTVAFKLRDNIGFTDGYGQMTADDVKFSIERIADPPWKAPMPVTGQRSRKSVKMLSGIIHLKTSLSHSGQRHRRQQHPASFPARPWPSLVTR